MCERESTIERLRNSIEDARQLQEHLEETITELTKVMKESATLQAKAREAVRQRPSSLGNLNFIWHQRPDCAAAWITGPRQDRLPPA